MESEILKWLNGNGYPLEMRISRDLAAKEFNVTQSHFYEDFETNVAREIDVIGRLYSFKEPSNYISIAELETFITIECKSSTKPWIVFCETKSNIWNIEQALCNKAGGKLLSRARDQLSKTALCKRSQSAGHGVAQAFGNGSDAPFAAVMSSFKAAEAKAIETTNREVDDKENNRHSEICLSAIAISVVVISAPLFECKLDDNGNVKLDKVNHSALVFRYPRGKEGYVGGAIVHIVTESGWGEFMDSVIEFHDVASKKLNMMIPAEIKDA